MVMNYTQFHDGALEGLWIDGETVHLFLATEDLQRFVIVAEGVAALTANGFKAGNILFEVLARDAAVATPEDIQYLYDLREGPPGEVQMAKLLETIRSGKQEILELNPSYGARCLLLASSYGLFRREEWLGRCVASQAS
jgi:hypothetical protein